MNPLKRVPLAVSLAASLGLAPSAFAGDHGMSDAEDWHEPFGNPANTFAAVKDELLKSYVRSDVTEADLYRAGVQGMLSKIDPKLASYNELLSPRSYGELQMELSGQIVGIGVQLRLKEENGVIEILGVMPGTPAERAGLAPGDEILSVGGKSFKGKAFHDVVDAIRGPEGEAVSMEVLHEAQVKTISIRRAKVTWDPVEHARYPGDVELLSINQFSERTPDALRRALTEISRTGAKGLVIDLRSNEGGLFEQAVNAAKLLLPNGAAIARLVHRGNETQTLVADGRPAIAGIPAVILVDGDTMSSAEMLASALRQGLHAPILGQKTKGKWSVQTLKELPNHYVIKYTVAVFQTPEGKSYEGEGLQPDIEVALDHATLETTAHLRDPVKRLAADAQLRSAVNLLRMRP